MKSDGVPVELSVAAIFWAYDGTPSLCAPPRLYNQIASQIGLEQGLDLAGLTRLLALVNVAMMDELGGGTIRETIAA